MELTITQNGALYFAHHKLPKLRASLFCRFGVAERPKGKARSLGWEAAEGLTEANPQNDSGLPRPLSQRRPEPARENNDSRYGSLKSPVWSCVSSTLPVSS